MARSFAIDSLIGPISKQITQLLLEWTCIIRWQVIGAGIINDLLCFSRGIIHDLLYFPQGVIHDLLYFPRGIIHDLLYFPFGHNTRFIIVILYLIHNSKPFTHQLSVCGIIVLTEFRNVTY